MDYIDGTDVAHLLERKYPAGMPTDLAMRITTAVASALDHAHQKGLLHRDVKPANIVVTDLDADEPNVYLADFGIARQPSARPNVRPSGTSCRLRPVPRYLDQLRTS